MNIKTNDKSKMYIIISLITVLAFFGLIINAYNFLPDNDFVIPNINNPIDNEKNESTIEKEESKTVVVDDSEDLEEVTNPKLGKSVESDIDFNQQNAVNEKLLDSVEVKNSVDVASENIYERAEKLLKEGNYEDSLSEYNSILKSTTDKNVQSECYEKISLIYARSKRYGSAISYAQRAVNLSPTLTREIILAKLYYKTNQQDKALKIIDLIFSRDFSFELSY